MFQNDVSHFTVVWNCSFWTVRWKSLEFSGMVYNSVFKGSFCLLCWFLSDSLFNITLFRKLVNNFFIFLFILQYQKFISQDVCITEFITVSRTLSCDSLYSIQLLSYVVNNFFIFFLFFLFFSFLFYLRFSSLKCSLIYSLFYWISMLTLISYSFFSFMPIWM